MQRTTANTVIAVLKDMWARFGLPKQVVSDNGPPFTSAEFKKFMENNNIEHVFTAPYHPASNGAAENAVKICKKTIKKAIKENIDIHSALCSFLLAYRNTEHQTTGDSPANILMGRKLRMRIDKIKPERDARVREKQERSAAAAGGAHRQLEQGESVWYRSYREPDRWLSGDVKDRLGRSDYSIRSSSGAEVHRHIDQLRRRVSSVTSPLAGSVERSSRRSRNSLHIPLTSEQTAQDTVLSEPAAGQDLNMETDKFTDALEEASPPPEDRTSVPPAAPARARRCPLRLGIDELF